MAAFQGNLSSDIPGALAETLTGFTGGTAVNYRTPSKAVFGDKGEPIPSLPATVLTSFEADRDEIPSIAAGGNTTQVLGNEDIDNADGGIGNDLLEFARSRRTP